MTFIEDDLKRLKEVGDPNLDALIARLEAAEEAVLAFHIIPKSNWTERIRLAVDKWRKVCGK